MLINDLSSSNDEFKKYIIQQIDDLASFSDMKDENDYAVAFQLIKDMLSRGEVKKIAFLLDPQPKIVATKLETKELASCLS